MQFDFNSKLKKTANRFPNNLTTSIYFKARSIAFLKAEAESVRIL